jgi:uncharacterized cupin superfamily protein
MPIGSLVTTTPGAGDVAGTSGPAELKDIKSQIKASFPAFTTGNDVVTKTAEQINNAPDKTAAETVTGNWTFTGTLGANGTVNFNAGGSVNLNGTTVVNGSWQFKSNAVIADGKSLRLQNSTNAVSTGISHDGTNLKVVEVAGTTDGFQIQDGIALRVYDPSNAQHIGMSCNGVNAFLFTNSGSIQVNPSGIFDIVTGAVFRIRDASSTDFVDFHHNGTNFLTTFVNTGNWNITGISNINLGSETLATQTYAANYVISTLNNNQSVAGVWNFTNGLQFSGSSVITAATLSTYRGHGKMSRDLTSVAGTGSYVTQTGTTGTVLLNVTHANVSGTLTVTNSGTYRLKLIFRAGGWSGTPGNAGIRVRLNGASDLVESVFTILSGEVNITRDFEDFASLSAGDNLQIQLSIPSGLTLVSGSVALLVERMS